MIVAKKKKIDVQDERIPSALWRGLKGLLVRNVGELKALLDLIPNDVAVSFSDVGGLRVSVSNNVIGAQSPPYVCFEELDDAEEYDDEDDE